MRPNEKLKTVHARSAESEEGGKERLNIDLYRKREEEGVLQVRKWHQSIFSLCTNHCVKEGVGKYIAHENTLYA